jgi:hypothetical protein
LFIAVAGFYVALPEGPVLRSTGPGQVAHFGPDDNPLAWLLLWSVPVAWVLLGTSLSDRRVAIGSYLLFGLLLSPVVTRGLACWTSAVTYLPIWPAAVILRVAFAG